MTRYIPRNTIVQRYRIILDDPQATGHLAINLWIKANRWGLMLKRLLPPLSFDILSMQGGPLGQKICLTRQSRRKKVTTKTSGPPNFVPSMTHLHRNSWLLSEVGQPTNLHSAQGSHTRGILLIFILVKFALGAACLASLLLLSAGPKGGFCLH